MLRYRLLLFLSLLLAGCTLGPTYQPPEPALPAAFKGEGPWRLAEPRDNLARGDWWQIFDDPGLNDLMSQAMAENPGLQSALSRVAQARAGLSVSRADRYPQFDLNASANRSRTSGGLAPTGVGGTNTFIDLPVDLGYEVDLWGRVQRSVEAAQAELEAGMADYHSARLSLQAEVARTWFSLRTLDSELVLLEGTIDLRRENLRLVSSRFQAGESSKLALQRAQTELATAEAEVQAVARSRTGLEHALAALTGQAASGFELARSPLDLAPPVVAAGLPSALLERRPDVAAAERRMAAANARIGIAHAAFYPDLRIFGSAGFQSVGTSDILDWDSRIWGLGPSLSLPLFDGGRNRANLQRAEAVWNEVAAAYRQQVLAAIGEVEDGLSSLHYLDRQADFLQKAVDSSAGAAELSRKRYRAGMVSYLEVVDAERTLLQAQRQAVRLLGQQLDSSVFLIKALGGGWDERSSTGSQDSFASES
ncbi:MAG TPA: efflux transporter outer membrane subunit [Desulfuromonadales bacterium]|nr:efflux transporter outer membrane subunit [Desulfuromonadales bacterium]